MSYNTSPKQYEASSNNIRRVYTHNHKLGEKTDIAKKSTMDVVCVYDGKFYRFRDDKRCEWGRFETMPEWVKPGGKYLLRFSRGVPVQLVDGEQVYNILPENYIDRLEHA